MSEAKLKRCLICHIVPGGVLTKILNGEGLPVRKRYFVLCACQKRRLFDSKKEAADAWNKANAMAST
jgi:hypothetical protein